MVYILPFGREVAIDKSRILSVQQITANLNAIYNVLCWSLYQVNAKYSPQIQFSKLCLRQKCSNVQEMCQCKNAQNFQRHLFALAS